MTEINQALQFFAWVIALVQFIIGWYVLYLEPRGFTHRSVGLSLLVISVDTFTVGLMASAQNVEEARLPSQILAATSAMVVASTLITTLALLQPTLIRRRSRSFVVWATITLGLIPLIVTLLDALLGTQLWYSGLQSNTYTGGYIPADGYAMGRLSQLINLLIYGLLGFALVTILIYSILFDRRITRPARIIAIWLLLASSLTILSAFGSFQVELELTLRIGSSTLYLIGYVFAVFSQVITEPTLRRRGSLQVRLTALALIVALPLLAGMGIFLTQQAQLVLGRDASQALNASNRSIVDAAEIWLTYNTRALRTLVGSPDIISMDPARQIPTLHSLVGTYPDIYLASTTDTSGMNVARSDGSQAVNYSDRLWFKQPLSGQLVTYQTMVGSSGQPAVVISMPIRKSNGDLIGVAMAASDLRVVSQILGQAIRNTDATVLLVNSENRILASSGQPVGILMEDISEYPPVKRLRSGVTGDYAFTDINDIHWRASLNILTNGWGVIVQQSEESLFAPVRNFQRISLIVLLVGAGLLFWLTWLTIREVMQPVRSLTDTATAISAGDLNRSAQVYGEDELGILAASFNTMTSQLRDLIGSLENRVSERTRDLEHRALQLQVTAQVAREAAAIHNPEKLIQDAVKLISEKFNYYHAGIFLINQASSDSTVDPTGSEQRQLYAVLCAASSDGGRRMLNRGHQLRVGQQGIVGYVAGTGEPRIALDTEKDSAYFDNPDLPLTRSEMALPMKIGNRVIGVLDVQSKLANAFNSEDLETLQILADQLAVALENARLLAESQQALQELDEQYGQQVRIGWQRTLSTKYRQRVGYQIGSLGVKPLAEAAEGSDKPQPADAELPSALISEISAPIEVRNQRLGTLNLRRQAEMGEWTEQDKSLIHAVVTQMSLALENARLLEEIRDRARQEELINQIVANTQNTLSLEGAMRIAIEEVVRVFNVNRARIRLIGNENGNGDQP
jgi:GAF domain-containing protein/HAMP domain-containing protein